MQNNLPGISAVVFRHPGGGRLRIGDAASVDIYEGAGPAEVTVVDVKQVPRAVNASEVICYPLADTPDGLSDLEGLADLLGEIDQRLRSGRDVHVVCALGRSRSGAVVTNYVASVLGIEFREALALVRYAYPLVQPNPGFYEASQNFGEVIANRVQRVEVSESQLQDWHEKREPVFFGQSS